MLFNTSLYLVTDKTGMDEKLFLHRVEQALIGGVTLLQLREKENTTTREYLSLAIKVKHIADAYNVPLIIDDRFDVALACDAAGVHLGQSDMPVEIARRFLGPNKIIGATAKTVPQAVEASNQGADYLGVGAICPTTTKVKTILTSVETVDSICGAVSIPVVAIGGLNKDTIHRLKDSPINGIAVVSAIMKSDDSQQAAKELRDSLRDGWGL